VVNGGLFGALWGVLPAVAFPRAPIEVQLFIAVLTAGMMCAGGFVLATVPLAGVRYVTLVGAGALYGLLQGTGRVYSGLSAMPGGYTAVLIANVNWSGSSFVSSRLAEAQVGKEVAA